MEYIQRCVCENLGLVHETRIMHAWAEHVHVGSRDYYRDFTDNEVIMQSRIYYLLVT